MSFASKHNATQFEVNTEGFQYFNLETLYENEGAGIIYPVLGVYINTKSKYGDAPVIISNDKFINLPSHLNDTVKNILSDMDDVASIKSGRVGMTIYTYDSHNKKCYSVNWVDM